MLAALPEMIILMATSAAIAVFGSHKMRAAQAGPRGPASRSMSAPAGAGLWGHGDRLPGRAYPPAPPVCHQADPPRPSRRSPDPHALRARSTSDRDPDPPEHDRGL